MIRSMRIKQERQIKLFLIGEFGVDKGNIVFNEQENMLREMIGEIRGKSKAQRKALIQTILPRIALYKVMLKSGFADDDIYKYMKEYMLGIVGKQKHLSMVRMERVPCFYGIYSRVFLRFVRKMDLWESEQRCDKNSFDVTMNRCLWHTACVENGCGKLCCLFCDVDNVTYGGLKKLGFSRTKTLGYGNDCCDFHFYKK